MKRSIIALLFLSCGFAYGQSLKLFYDKQYKNPNDTIDINIPNDDVERNYYLDIVNVSSSNIEMMIKRELISLLSGVENRFCFGLCYEPNVNMTSDPYTFLAGDTLSHDDGSMDYFYTSYNAQGQQGVSIIKYTFYDNNNSSDTTSVIFRFTSGNVGIKDNAIDVADFKAYPNPATTKLTIRHNCGNKENARLRISNLMGMELKSIPITNSNETQIDVSGFASGIYFYSLEVNGKISVTKKFIIK